MGKKRKDEDNRAGPGACYQPAPLLYLVHEFKTDETGGVIQKVGRSERKKNNARNQPDALRNILDPEPAACIRWGLARAVPHRSAFHAD